MQCKRPLHAFGTRGGSKRNILITRVPTGRPFRCPLFMMLQVYQLSLILPAAIKRMDSNHCTTLFFDVCTFA